MRYLTTFILLLKFQYISTVRLNDSPDVKPIFIAEIFRHGSRYPTRDLFNESVVKNNVGQLLPTGMQQHYRLGKAIKKTYLHLFSKKYNHQEVKFISTRLARTYESALAHFMGMFDLGSGKKLKTNDERFVLPPFVNNNKNKEWSNLDLKAGVFALNHGFQTVPIFAGETRSLDELFIYFPWVDKNCPKIKKIIYDDIIKFTENLSHYTKLLDKYLKSIQGGIYDPRKQFGYQSYRIQNYFRLHEYCEYYKDAYGKLPDYITEPIYSLIKLASYTYFYSTWFYEKVQRLYTQNIMKYILNEIKQKISTKENYKLNYLALSGHDVTIAPLLLRTKLASWECILKRFKTATTVQDNECIYEIPYASNIIIEQSEVKENSKIQRNYFNYKVFYRFQRGMSMSIIDDDKEYVVRMIYNGNKIMINCTDDKISQDILKETPKYRGYCTLQEFNEIVYATFTLDDQFSEVCV